MEFSYLSDVMRDVTLNKDAARRLFGAEDADAFHSLVADMRDAMFVGELPDEPIQTGQKDQLLLRLRLGPGTYLEIEPLGSEAKAGNWRDAYRVKFLHIHREGEVLA
ncbi:hypothetical protein PY365_18875 [Roseiarcaceae bacterium H3SJ34-1]|uniref:hypothetical protein n=1 Tax=Terripilifer ovatus TaxID=3032367 RepID=UPI003AB94816|nr:hypothetical protein [Roseiarcaceae bacterium H3SJ34-1]